MPGQRQIVCRRKGLEGDSIPKDPSAERLGGQAGVAGLGWAGRLGRQAGQAGRAGRRGIQASSWPGSRDSRDSRDGQRSSDSRRSRHSRESADKRAQTDRKDLQKRRPAETQPVDEELEEFYDRQEFFGTLQVTVFMAGASALGACGLTLGLLHVTMIMCVPWLRASVNFVTLCACV